MTMMMSDIGGKFSKYVAPAVLALSGIGSATAQQCATSPDPADTSCTAAPQQAMQALAAPAALAADPLNVAYINDNGDLIGFSSVQRVVTEEGLGSVTLLSIQDVLNGALDTGGYDVVFNARHYFGPSTGGTGFPFTLVPPELDQALDRALLKGIGVITEWQGGSPMWSALPAPGTTFHYYQMLDSNGELWSWHQGVVDRGDSGWFDRVFVNLNPAHPVMENIAPVFSIGGVEFCYRVQDPDPSLEVLATLNDVTTGVQRPAILAGRRLNGNVVNWPCDWGDNGGNDPNVRAWIANAIRFAANPVIEVAVDVRPGGCPNPLNVQEQGVVPVAILGTPEFDVTTVDPATVRIAGVPALRSSLQDVATPFTPFTGKVNPLDCTTAGPDGLTDLVLHFGAQALVDALGPVNDGQVVILKLTGNLQPPAATRAIAGEDVVVILKKGR